MSKVGWALYYFTAEFGREIVAAAAATVYSAPDDGRKVRPKHVEHTCSC
jgi:hypothetical protein